VCCISDTSKKIKEELSTAVSRLSSRCGGAVPTLAVILVGSRKDSQSYVANKTKSCKEIGMNSEQINLPENTPEAELLAVIDRLNSDAKVNGILVQLPLPAHIDSAKAIERISPSKDVDGLTQPSQGAVFQHGVKAPLIPCTPLGCIELLDRYNIPISGAHAVVIGRSALVGKPVAQLLLSRDATVTVCHSRTRDLPNVVRSADIVIAAIGRAEFVKGDWVKPGAAVIDVGINAVDDASKKAGYRLVGDVEYAQAARHAKAITPVPGGVGPMTVAMLLRNTLKAAARQHGINFAEILPPTAVPAAAVSAASKSS
jgi:5,10-methylene-tetrahydrofolate dehydrogenase/methenyl tetrahydrofolate cyclohydrolase